VRCGRQAAPADCVDVPGCPAYTGRLGARHWDVCVTRDLELAEADLLVAATARHQRVQFGSAAVPEHRFGFVVAGVPLSPLREREDHGDEIHPGLCEVVLETDRVLRVLPPHDDACLLQPSQAAGQQGAWRASELGQVGEAVEAVQQLSQYGQRVTVTEDLQRVGQ